MLVLCMQEALFHSRPAYLGEGAFGKVYRCKVPFAVKTVRAHLSPPLPLLPLCTHPNLRLFPCQAGHADTCMLRAAQHRGEEVV
jgi:hypothetical protein